VEPPSLVFRVVPLRIFLVVFRNSGVESSLTTSQLASENFLQTLNALKHGEKPIVINIVLWLSKFFTDHFELLNMGSTQDFVELQASSAIKGLDVLHQLIRLRHAKNMADSEISIIMRTLADNSKSYEQVVEVI
jgi:hypothetical protein